MFCVQVREEAKDAKGSIRINLSKPLTDKWVANDLTATDLMAPAVVESCAVSLSYIVFFHPKMHCSCTLLLACLLTPSLVSPRSLLFYRCDTCLCTSLSLLPLHAPMHSLRCIATMSGGT